jgi:hypothetical protein
MIADVVVLRLCCRYKENSAQSLVEALDNLESVRKELEVPYIRPT